MKTPKVVFHQIDKITWDLVCTEICVDQNPPIIRESSSTTWIEVPKINVATAMKKQPYRELYYAMEKERSFNIKLVDGAMILLQYCFEHDAIQAHRLCFFPNPDLLDFQSYSSDYLEDDLYLDILDPRIEISPIRFDFDCRPEVQKDVFHPASHLTIGQYENCRIPVISPLMPSQFFDFIIRNFYNTIFVRYSDLITKATEFFSDTITPAEAQLLHMSIVK